MRYRFRWVILQVDLFLRIELPQDFDNATQRLAETTMSLKGDDKAILYSAYDEMYDANVGHSPTDAYAAQAGREAVVQRLLLWTLCAQRPLRLSEMLEAVKLNDNGSTLDGIDEKYLLTKGSNFVRKDTQQRIVFTHLSVREYLIDSGNKPTKERFCYNETSRNLIIAKNSINMFQLRQPIPANWEFLINSVPSGFEWSFHSYCCTYWITHWQVLGSSDGTDLLNEVLLKYVAPLSSDHYVEELNRYVAEKPHFHRSASSLETEAVQCIIRVLNSTESEPISRILSFVQCLAACSLLSSTSKDDLKEIPYIELEGLLHKTPGTLMELAITRCDTMLEMLLHSDTRFDARTARNYNLLHVAAAEGTMVGMGMLLRSPSAAACLNIAQTEGLTPIEVALAQHNFECADLLWSALLEEDEGSIPDSIAKLYTTSLCRTRTELESRYTAEPEAHASNGFVCGTLSNGDVLCSLCLKVFSRRGDSETGHDLGLTGVDLGSQAFPTGVSLGSPIELATRAAHGCMMCNLLQKLNSETLSPKEKARILAQVDTKLFAMAVVSTFSAFYYAFGTGFFLLFLWSYFALYHEQKSAFRVVVRSCCTKLPFRERYMNIWTVEVQKGVDDPEVVSRKELEIAQSRGEL